MDKEFFQLPETKDLWLGKYSGTVRYSICGTEGKMGTEQGKRIIKGKHKGCYFPCIILWTILYLKECPEAVITN